MVVVGLEAIFLIFGAVVLGFGVATTCARFAFGFGTTLFAVFTGTGRFFAGTAPVALWRFAEAVGCVLFAGAFFVFSAAHRFF